MSAVTTLPLLAAQLLFVSPAHAGPTGETNWLDCRTSIERKAQAETTATEAGLIWSIGKSHANTQSIVGQFWYDPDARRIRVGVSQTGSSDRLPKLFNDVDEERHLTVEEQHLFHSALRKSVRVIARGARL